MRKDILCTYCMFSRCDKKDFLKLFKKRHCSFYSLNKKPVTECDYFLPIDPKEYDEKTKIKASNAKIIKAIKEFEDKK